MDKPPIDPKIARLALDLRTYQELTAKYELALNHAFDAIRDGQSILATNIIKEALGYEVPEQDQ